MKELWNIKESELDAENDEDLLIACMISGNQELYRRVFSNQLEKYRDDLPSLIKVACFNENTLIAFNMLNKLWLLPGEYDEILEYLDDLPESAGVSVVIDYIKELKNRDTVVREVLAEEFYREG